jgi:tRNA-2-methylthio-N6-dimethylallyladenosine synthase
MQELLEKHATETEEGLGGYHILTWGCQMNEEDSEQMGLFLEQMGYRPVEDINRAEVILLNTCSVRAKPEEKVWSVLGKLRNLKERRPEVILGVCGCMAQVRAEEFRERAPHVDMVIGTGNIAALPELVRQVKHRRAQSVEQAAPLMATSESHSAAPPKNFVPLTALSLPPRKGAVVTDVPKRVVERKPKLKAHVPIMYGCDKFCTFCIVPLTRGRERSRPPEEIVAEIEMLARQGTKEVTLLGQTVNSYGKNLPGGKVPFYKLLERINAIPGIERIRFTSPYPRDFSDELIKAIARLEHVCEHVHLPLQVGDDALLAHMHRGYTVAQFCEIVEKLRARVPGIAITTDLMLGYPGETEQQFENTLRVVEQIRFDSAFMFAYSPRPGTKAAAMENQVPREVKIERLNRLIALQNRITCEINAQQVGQVQEVLVEGFSRKDPSKLSGYTRTLKLVHFTLPPGSPRSPHSLIGRLVPVRLTEAHLTGFTGEFAG